MAAGYLTNGRVRSYFIDDHGDEINVGFYADGDYHGLYLSGKHDLDVSALYPL